MNNIHLINTLKQTNQDLCQEISMLKGRVQEGMNLLKEINDNFTKIWNSTLMSEKYSIGMGQVFCLSLALWNFTLGMQSLTKFSLFSGN